MQEPTPEKGNLDELTRLTLRIISLETELKKVAELNEARKESPSKALLRAFDGGSLGNEAWRK